MTGVLGKPTYEELEKRIRDLEKADSDHKKRQEALQVSERFLQRVFEAIQYGISVLDTDFNVIRVNRWIEQMYAHRKPLVGQKCYNLYKGRTSPCSRCPALKTLENGQANTEIIPYPSTDNPTGWIELSAFPVKDKDGRVVGIIEYANDITERKNAEEDLQNLHKTMDLAQDMAGIGYFSYDKKTGKRTWSSKMYENFGLNPELGPPQLEDIIKVFHPEDREAYEKNINDALFGSPYDQVAKIILPDGTHHFVHSRGYPKKNDYGDIIGLFGTSQDITELVLAERAKRESEENYRRMFENSVVGFFQSTPAGKFMKVNSAFAKIFHYESSEELLSKISDIETQYYVNPEDRRRYKTILQQQGKVDGFEHKAQCKDGAEIWVSNSTRAYFDEEGRVVRYEGAVKDITERKLAEEALRKSEERYRSLVENTLDGFFVCEIPSGRFLYLNQRICDLFRLTMNKAMKLQIWDVLDSAEKSIVRKRMQGRIEGSLPNFASHIYTVVRHDGSKFKAEVSTSLTTYQGKQVFQGILRDVTEKENLELQLRQAQKFEAIGTLAGGIAHDFNNLLMGIQGRASLAIIDLGLSHPQREHLDAIEEYVKSATHLTKQLLGFSRSGKYEVKPVEVNELLAASADMFGRTHKEIHIHQKMHPGTVVIEADKRQIEQVLLNIFINAWQAMQGGGDLFVETSVVHYDQFEENQGVEPGSYAKISITDAGVGMDDETRQRIFDPFFTTKHKNRGTGLGLASAYGIVRNHGGLITVYSKIDHGATFIIYLPLSDKKAIREEAAETEPLRGSETALLVDDEAMIREVAQGMLAKLGYRVMTAASGENAVDVVAEKGDEIDFVILDLIMPGMDGGKTFNHIRRAHPEMPVLLSSGYAINGQAEEIMQRGCNGFIQKPFNILELSKKIRKILVTSQ